MIIFIKSGIKKFYAALALLSLEFVVVFGLFFVAILIFIQIARMVFRQRKDSFDVHAFDFFSSHITSFNTEVMLLFSFLGSNHFMIPANIILISYFIFFKKHRWYSIKVPVVALSSFVMMSLLKYIFHRPRPHLALIEQARGFSFPSGHAMTSVTFYGLLIYLVWRNIKQIYIRWFTISSLIMIIILIGLSRIYLRVHYASDVIAGFCTGLIWLVLSIWFLRKIEGYLKRNQTASAIG